MKLALCLLTVLSLSCAHVKRVAYLDDSEESKGEIGWVCVEDKQPDRDWSCVSMETFGQMLKRVAPADM